MSHRSDRPFLAFNCGAFTETLLESELFGHEKGAFTGATGRKRGIFELAHRGTLFLDEIDSASPAIQIKLLRILETGEFLRVGGEELVKVDVRIITATNTDLASQVEAHKFREDLFYRLDVASLTIPPLRERKEDIPLLVNYFLERETVEKGLPAKRMDAEAMELLLKHPLAREHSGTGQYHRPGGSLQQRPGHLCQRSSPRIRREEAVEASKKEEPAAAKPAVLIPSDHPEKEKLAELLQQFEELLLEKLEIKKGFDLKTLQESLKGWVDRLSSQIIAKALEATYDNQTKAARLLHITPRTLRYSRQEKNLLQNKKGSSAAGMAYPPARGGMEVRPARPRAGLILPLGRRWPGGPASRTGCYRDCLRALLPSAIQPGAPWPGTAAPSRGPGSPPACPPPSSSRCAPSGPASPAGKR